MLVIDNASHDGSHTKAIASHPWARLIENPENVFLSPAWNQGIREHRRAVRPAPEPRHRVVDGDARRLRGGRAHAPTRGDRGADDPQPDGTVYPSGRPIPSVVDAAGHAFIGPFAPGNRFSRRYRMEGWDRTTEREVDWVSGCCMLLPRKVFDEVGLLDESFLLYGEELDLATRLRDAGWSVLFTPRVEVLHAIGVSTGRSRRMTVMHSASIYRYYRKHRAVGWRKLTLPVAWMALRVRAEVAWMRGRFAG